MPRSTSLIAIAVLLAARGMAVAQEPPAGARQSAEPAARTPFDQEHPARFAEGLKLFKSDVRQVLAGRCVKCHGTEATEGEFDLNTREGLLQGGAEGAAIVVGNAKQSRLVALISHQAEPNMPMDGARLNDRDIDNIARWIELGAPYDKPLVQNTDDPLAWTRKEVDDAARNYWAFQPLAHAAPPLAAGDAWSRTAIDRFVLAGLQEQGLTPNGLADKQTLIRRASFDLTGLPPTQQEIETFLADDDPQAYARLIDRLLKSPHYGERWGRHWLDVARFAESHGFEQDYNREHAYHFRDFVIKALNQDMPYDQFVRWQLAGDEIAPDDPLAMMATGFLGAGVFPTQITKNEVERTRYDALDDMAATTGAAMLGLTIGCARCHDHKFDPIPQADYYRFTSTFTTTVRSNQEIVLNAEEFGRQKDAFDEAHAPLADALAKYEREQLPGRLAQWEQSSAADYLHRQWIVLELAETKSAGGAAFTAQNDGSVLVGGANPETDTFTIVAHTTAADITSVRLEALSDPSLPKNGPGRAGNGNFALTDFRLTAAPRSGGEPVEVGLDNPRATFQQEGLPIGAAIDDDEKSGWAVDPQFGRNHAAAFALKQPLVHEGGSTLTFTLAFKNNKQHAIGRLRLAVASHPEPNAVELAGGVPQSIVAVLGAPADHRTPEQTAALLKWFGPLDDQWRELNARVEEHLAQAPRPDTATVMICSEGVTPIRHHTQGADFFEQTYYLHRGDTDQKLAVADQSFLQVLMRTSQQEQRWKTAPPEHAATSHRRSALADWITDAEYGAGHLLARVIVNRLWQHHMGQGIVATSNDFGAQGERPTNPQLLDWLAAELIRENWRLKPLHKLIMTSAAYMQTAEFDAHDARIDPENRLCWRRSPERLQAEIIRDSMLAVSGLLDRTMYGPGTLDETHKRRSIYFMIKRSQLIPMMQLFDAPEPLVSVGGRPTTTIAPQALLLMNGPQVRQYARGFADIIAPQDDQSLADAVDRGFVMALARSSSPEELADAVTFVEAQQKSYAEQDKPDSLQLALTDFCQALFCMNEFVYVE